MKKSKIFTSLVVITCIVFLLGTMSVFADTTPTTITTITTSSNNAANIADISNNSANKANTSNKATNNAPTTIGTSNANTNKVSTYDNSAKDNSLPYTGSSYSVVVIIAALAISAVYAYKKITDYNV